MKELEDSSSSVLSRRRVKEEEIRDKLEELKDLKAIDLKKNTKFRGLILSFFSWVLGRGNSLDDISKVIAMLDSDKKRELAKNNIQPDSTPEKS